MDVDGEGTGDGSASSGTEKPPHVHFIGLSATPDEEALRLLGVSAAAALVCPCMNMNENIGYVCSSPYTFAGLFELGVSFYLP